jgi:2-polyprenyl-3-methyl-5-hydroxy-6-metoxy-1,4-benzoquinol methylase
MNQWDELVDTFGCSWEEETIPETVADNICVAWPSINKCIESHFPEPLGRKALDFGCGGGLFCRVLAQQGFAVTGFDKSTKLAESARRNISNNISVTTSETQMLNNGGYDLISSIMVLQFIEDINTTISKLVSVLNKNGLLIFAVFNPKFIEDNSECMAFSSFKDYRSGYMELKEGLKIPVYNRSHKEYRNFFKALGLEEVYLDYPEFNQEFLSKYEMPFSTTFSEFQIQGFKRKGT